VRIVDLDEKEEFIQSRPQPMVDQLRRRWKCAPKRGAAKQENKESAVWG
jgi:hypothetical protein